MKFEFTPYHRNISDSDLADDLSSVAKKLGSSSPTLEEYKKHGKFSPSTLIKRFGSWGKALTIAGCEHVRFNGGIDTDCAIEDVKQVCATLGKVTLTSAEYDNNGRFTAQPLIRKFGTWNEVLRAAGIESSRRYKVPNEELFANIERMWRVLGRQPKYAEVAKPFSQFSSGTYERRFGNWGNALKAFVDMMNTASAEATNTDVEAVDSIPIEIKKNPFPRTINWRLRFLVMQRDGFRCRLCGRSPATELGIKLHADHIHPWSKGGKTVIDNLQTCCEQCNIGKSDLPMDAASEI